MEDHLTARQADLRVWAPDAIGSVCFLIASQLAFCGTCRAWFAVRAHERDWWIAAVNLLGSIAFGIAAVASLVLPSGDAVSATLSNATTAAGAACFLVGALLLLPHEPRSQGQKVRVPRAERA
nr:YrhK family protein [Conexibacter arvalis]